MSDDIRPGQNCVSGACSQAFRSIICLMRNSLSCFARLSRRLKSKVWIATSILGSRFDAFAFSQDLFDKHKHSLLLLLLPNQQCSLIRRPLSRLLFQLIGKSTDFVSQAWLLKGYRARGNSIPPPTLPRLERRQTGRNVADCTQFSEFSAT